MEIRAKNTRVITTSFMTKVSVLAILGFLLMLIQVKIPFCPPFMEFDLGDLPAVVGTMVLGPIAGIWIELIKNLIKCVFNSSTAGIGEFANFIMGIAYVIPIGYFYKKNKNVKGFLIGTIIGSILMTISACILNYYLLIPVYTTIFGMPLESIVSMTTAVNGFVVDLKTLIFYSVAPFNIFKAIVLSFLGYFMSKLVVPFVK